MKQGPFVTLQFIHQHRPCPIRARHWAEYQLLMAGLSSLRSGRFMRMRTKVQEVHTGDQQPVTAISLQEGRHPVR